MEVSRIESVRSAMEKYFGEDRRRITHAHRVAEFARRILEKEKGDRETVLAAAYLHDIGIPEAERKYGSCAGHLQEEEGPPVAREILETLGYGEELIAEVCAIIASHHSPGEVDTCNFRIIWDADWLVNMADEIPPEKRGEAIPRIFMTQKGREIAGEEYGKETRG